MILKMVLVALARSLYDDAIKAGLVVTLNEVKEWLKSQSIKQRSSYNQYNSFFCTFCSCNLFG